MTGSIRKRATDKWQITIELGGLSRNRRYCTVNGKKKDAEKKMREMIYELEHGTLLDGKEVLVEEWMQEWIDNYITGRVQDTTLDGYINHINNYILPTFGEYKLQNISTIQIQQWVNRLSVASPCNEDKGLSSKTIRNVFLNLKASLDKAVVLNLIPKNPCDGVELPKGKKYSPTVYTMEQVKALLDEAKGTDMELPLHIAIALGLRRGELLALRWENVDLDIGIANICENMVRANGGVIVKEPKTSSGIRKIAIPDYLVEMLRAEKRLRESQYGEALLPTLPIVCKEDGTPYKPDSFSQKFSRLLERNNLEHIRLHDLRHINATILLKQGVSAKVIQGRLGHSDVSTTLNIYSHVLEEVDRGAAEKLDEVLKK